MLAPRVPLVPGCVLSVLIAITATVACSEERGNDDVFVSTQDKKPYSLDAGVNVSGRFTDNVFLTANDRRQDFVTLISPWMGLNYRSEDFRLNLEASAEIARFSDYSSENYEDFFLGAEALYRVNDHVFAFGGLDLALGHESRESPDDVNGLAPTSLREASGYFGLGGTVSDRSFRLGVNIRDFNYDDTPAALGTVIDNDDRDRRQIELGGRIGIAKTKDGEVFFQGIFDKRSYDQSVDNHGTGYQRSSQGYQAALGYTGSIGAMQGEVLLGVMSQNYDDPRFSTTTAFDLGVDITMPLGDGTELDAIVERSIEETTLNGASGYVSTSAGFRLRHRVASDLSLAAHAFLKQNAYQELARTDMISEAGLSVRYHLNARAYLDANYDFRQRLSDVAGTEFDEHRISLVLGTSLEPRFSKDEGNLAAVGERGFYAGLSFGNLALQTKVDGPRGAGGNLTADFGDQGPVGGVFAGYRAEYGALVLGAETELEFSNASWSHLGDRRFTVKRGNAISLTGLTGLRTASGNLLYGRFGVVSSEFESTYQSATSALATRKERETGLLFGTGAEFPLGKGFSGRMEYQIRAYGDYPLGPPSGGSGDDNFANVESLARFGLVYDLGSAGRSTEHAEPTDFSGAYWGVQVGHGVLQSENAGARPTSAASVFTLDAMRAGQGFGGGVFAGYGDQFGKFYLGGEVELEASSTGWNIERSPEGRIYSVEKTGTVGAGVRLGYVLNDAVLLYARAGVVRSQFDTNYSYSGITANQTSELQGVRLGGGVEFAVGKNARARLDYTLTNYDTDSIDYGLGVDSFDTEERLFRIGLVRRF